MSPQPDEGPAEQGRLLSTSGLEDDPDGLEHLRQMLGRFNHRCRNSLNGIKMGLYLFKREGEGPMHRSWIELAQNYEEIERMFDRLHVIYRPLSLTMVRSPLGLLVAERLPSWGSLFSRNGRALDIDRPNQDDSGDFDPMYLGLGLDAFTAWRAEAGHPKAQSCLSWRIADGCFEVSWNELRPGNHSPGEQDEIGIPQGPWPSIRIDTLALPLLARVVAAHGGYLEATSDSAFGIKLWWPQFQSSEPTK